MAYMKSINDLLLKNIYTTLDSIKFCQFHKNSITRNYFEVSVNFYQKCFSACCIYLSTKIIIVTQCIDKAQNLLITCSANFASTSFYQQWSLCQHLHEKGLFTWKSFLKPTFCISYKLDSRCMKYTNVHIFKYFPIWTKLIFFNRFQYKMSHVSM
jgi:hypothetical protein